MAAIWAGIDAGKTHHHCVAIDESGHRLLSRRVANDEPELLELLTDVLALGDEVIWGIDLADGGAALAITILLNHDQQVHYISGRAIHRASESYPGEGKTDARDAAVIADQVRIRRDLHPIPIGDEAVIDLKILTGRRMDLVADRTRTVNRLRAQLTGIFPGLERVLDLTNKGPLTLLTGYQTPAAIRRLGAKRLETWLRNRKVLRADQLAETAVEAAERQHTSLPGEKLTAQMVHTLAKEVMALNGRVAELDKLIEARFSDHHHFEVWRAASGLRPRGLQGPARGRVRHQPAEAEPGGGHPVRQARGPLRSHRPHRRDQRMAVTCRTCRSRMSFWPRSGQRVEGRQDRWGLRTTGPRARVATTLTTHPRTPCSC
ncbi:IS110 family transposase [Streptomyces rubiginosohelvolus]|uniref:IS110 family transposase n=1 Tax=Streptomyces rubiginosohelvolus TaxID=67362 RepID=UPI0038035AE5